MSCIKLHQKLGHLAYSHQMSLNHCNTKRAKALTVLELSFFGTPDNNSTSLWNVLKFVISSSVIEEEDREAANGRPAVAADVIQSTVARPSASKPYNYLKKHQEYKKQLQEEDKRGKIYHG
ncbi:unnamed protein product [Camellia sinensis]